jgi:hypothetical protein
MTSERADLPSGTTTLSPPRAQQADRFVAPQTVVRMVQLLTAFVDGA